MKHRLVVVTGSPGSGKTHYGKQLAADLGAVFLDIDTATEPIVKAALEAMQRDPNDRDSPEFKRDFRQPIYETLFAVARENLAHVSVVLTGPFTSELGSADWPDELKQQFGQAVEIHYTYCDPETRRDRIARRSNPRDASKLADWENHLAYYGEEEPPCFDHTFVDTSC